MAFTNYKILSNNYRKRRRRQDIPSQIKAAKFFLRNRVNNELITILSNYANSQAYNRLLFVFKSILIYV